MTTRVSRVAPTYRETIEAYREIISLTIRVSRRPHMHRGGMLLQPSCPPRKRRDRSEDKGSSSMTLAATMYRLAWHGTLSMFWLRLTNRASPILRRKRRSEDRVGGGY
jgi:hypothetical protein